MKDNAPLAALPALSRQVPATDALELSGPEYWADEQPCSPDIVSPPEKPTTTGRLYQPFASGRRSALPVTDGGVLSILIVTVTAIVMSPGKIAVHVMLVAAVSATSVLASQPLEDSGSGSNTQLIVTLLVYQPLLPSVPTITGVIEALGVEGRPAAVGDRRSVVANKSATK